MRMGQTHHRFEHSRLGSNRLLEMRDGFARTARCIEAKTEIVSIKHVVGLSPDGLGKAFDGNAMILCLGGESAQEVQSFGMIGIVAKNELVTILGLFEFSRLLKSQPTLQNLQDFLWPFCIGAD